LEGADSVGHHDCHASLLSLPGLFGTVLETIPAIRDAGPIRDAARNSAIGPTRPALIAALDLVITVDTAVAHLPARSAGRTSPCTNAQVFSRQAESGKLETAFSPPSGTPWQSAVASGGHSGQRR